MSTMSITGSLAGQMAAFVSAFNGAQLVNKYDSGTFLFVYKFPFATNLTGYDLRVPDSGSSFITGTITKLKYQEVTLPIEFHEKLVLDDISISASSLFDLISRTATAATGKFNVDAFKSLLAGRTWEIDGSDMADTISAGAYYDLAGSEIIKTGAGADVISAGAGDDRIFAGSGNDTVSGDGGNDRVLGGGGDDTLSGGNQADYVNGGGGNDQVNGNAGNDRVIGGAGADTLTGANGRDVLSGGKGNDQLKGGKGADRLEGGGGADILTGGQQNDTFVFGKGDGRDRVTDFQAGSDRLELSRDLFAGAANDTKLATLAHMNGLDVVISFGGGDRLVLEDLGSIDALAGSVDFVA